VNAIKSYLKWVRDNAIKVFVTCFVLVLLLLPFIVVPMMKLRARIPGMDKLAPKPPAPATP
jgi:hypothetical protein